MVFVFKVKLKATTSKKEFISSFDMMKTELGFESLMLLQDESNSCEYVCIEKWRSKADHAQHVAGVADEVKKSWLALLAEPPSQMQFYEVAATLNA